MRILIVDGTEALRSLIEQQADMQVVGEATCGSEAVKLAKELSPDVVIIDISVRNLNGVEITRQIVRELAGVKVIALAENLDQRLVREILEAGASDYLTKEYKTGELIASIRSMAGGALVTRTSDRRKTAEFPMNDL